ncbi:MAG: hypothetical protein GF313_07115 [Caldithrix sp.]|nr:hypothetical protein [Caldithrix sp.]
MHRTKQNFREIEHTADVGLEVWGKSLSDLFLNAATGYYNLVLKNHPASTDFIEKTLELQEETPEELLVAFLSELNYLVNSHFLIGHYFYPFNLEQRPDNQRLTCKVRFITIPASLRDKLAEIKAVTYHQLSIENQDGWMYTKIFFDI